MLHENGLLGSIAKGLFGYNGNPSLLEVLSYLGYLISVSSIWLLGRSAVDGRRTRERLDRREAQA